jgi:hypothetical protein
VSGSDECFCCGTTLGGAQENSLTGGAERKNPIDTSCDQMLRQRSNGIDVHRGTGLAQRRDRCGYGTREAGVEPRGHFSISVHGQKR